MSVGASNKRPHCGQIQLPSCMVSVRSPQHSGGSGVSGGSSQCRGMPDHRPGRACRHKNFAMTAPSSVTFSSVQCGCRTCMNSCMRTSSLRLPFSLGSISIVPSSQHSPSAWCLPSLRSMTCGSLGLLIWRCGSGGGSENHRHFGRLGTFSVRPYQPPFLS